MTFNDKNINLKIKDFFGERKGQRLINLLDVCCNKANSFCNLVKECLTIRNGLSKLTTGEIELGGELEKETTILIPDGTNLDIKTTDNIGINIYHDGADDGVAISNYDDKGFLFSNTNMLFFHDNIIVESDLITIKGSSPNVYMLFEDGDKIRIGDVALFLQNLPVFANEAAASSLALDRVYKTPTGELRIKL